MTPEQLRKLRSYYHVLLEHQRVLDELAPKYRTVELKSVRALVEELSRLTTDFQDLVPPFHTENFYSHTVEGFRFYDLVAIRSHIGSVLGRLKVAIEASESSPVIQAREFTFIKDPNLRKILERDYAEIQRAYIASCWKSVIILSGSALEAILLDLVRQNEARTKTASNAPKKKPDVTMWDLSELIEVCVELKLIAPYAQTVSGATRAYRNLVHPGNELRTGLAFGAEEARISVIVLDMLHRDLSV